MARIDNTVFISYRRTNAFHALAIYQHLDSLGYDVFYDVHSLRGGDWLQSIIENIKARAHFLIILTPSAYERFEEPNDVMRLEIETAIEYQRNIIPLMMEDFDFAVAKPYLTGKLAVIPDFNGLPIPARYFKYAMQDLHEMRLQQDISTIIYPASVQALAFVSQQNEAVKLQPKVSETQLKADELIEQGVALVLKYEFIAALEEIEKAIKLQPENFTAHFMRGYINNSTGNYEQAINDFDKAIHLKQNYSEAYNNRGNSKFILGYYNEALNDYNISIQFQPDYFSAYINRAILKYRMNDYAGAIVDYDTSIHLKSDNAIAYNNRANAKTQIQDYEGAIADYKRSIELGNPELNLPYNNLAALKIETGNYDDAIADCTSAIHLKLNYAEAYNNRGVANFCKDNIEDAISDYDKAIYLKPDLAMAYNNRGYIKYVKGDYDGAIADYEMAMRIDPNHQIAKDNLEIARKKKQGN